MARRRTLVPHSGGCQGVLKEQSAWRALLLGSLQQRCFLVWPWLSNRYNSVRCHCNFGADGSLCGGIGATPTQLSSLTIHTAVQLDLSQARLVALAAILANLFESVLGALIQGKESTKWLTNDIVNMMQICLAAYLAMIFIDI